MKKKFKVLVAISVLMICMSSCVYSLLPIYTEESIVYLPELIGKWELDGFGNRTVEFKSGSVIDTEVSIARTEPVERSQVKVNSSISVTIEDGDYIVVKGDTIRDKEKVQAYWDAQMDSLGEELEGDLLEFGENLEESFSKMGAAFNKLGKALNNIGSANTMKYSSSSKSYKMVLNDEGQIFEYEATLTLIGDDYFLDLYATESDHVDLTMESRVWFPVHTFMKLEVEADRLAITEFDLHKMNKLFESNLVRMRHENVDGTILITAKTEELRKFLEKYSNDESVFEKPEYYQKVEL
ncbi:hypothetical protein [Roseivirga misakiensis]|uniref:Uncharacterized protein n=1 Tax=Roseivirga misakiensis TaxID=1563681 RepID=A0A1E5SKV7_9BACT|nr:hypothetical protein [Roseivirga misakiensis]OEJ99767.1 hypothetical protein BFP71_09385 [Roseivirga misakiensis]